MRSVRFTRNHFQFRLRNLYKRLITKVVRSTCLMRFHLFILDILRAGDKINIQFGISFQNCNRKST